jgi:hypothetical protein
LAVAQGDPVLGIAQGKRPDRDDAGVNEPLGVGEHEAAERIGMKVDVQSAECGVLY